MAVERTASPRGRQVVASLTTSRYSFMWGGTGPPADDHMEGEIPCSASSLLRRLDLRKGATVLGPVKDTARRRRAGLRPSLTSPGLGGLPAGRSGRRDDRLTIEQRDDDGFSESWVTQVVAAVSSVDVAGLGSNGF